MNAPFIQETAFLNPYRPHLLPKILSPNLLKSFKGLPCTLRISSFIPGHSCAGDDTCVPCHVSNVGKGMATKGQVVGVASGCGNCHDLIDRRDTRYSYIEERYPAAMQARITAGLIETLTLLILKGVIMLPSDMQIKQ